ncbi:MAG: hypothetical protein RL302_1673 [Pseudomonadota bacterium]|jgi:uncharacterized membrane protein
MAYLILGLVVFLGVHSVRIVAEDWRTQTRARVGENTFKGVYSVLSLLGFALIVWGFGVARETPVQVWSPPIGMRHAASLLTLIAFVFLAAAYVPRNAIKARVHHPMVLAVKSWALAHVLANGGLAHLVLFGAFLLWAVLDFIASRRRDRALGTTYPAGTASGTGITIVVGVVAWVAFAFWLHGLLIGIRPFG